MADKTTVQPEESRASEVQSGFYVFLGIMALAFLLIVGYMVFLFFA